MADERVGILIELEDPDHALETLKRVENEIRTLGRQKAVIKFDNGDILTVEERIDDIKNKLAAIKAGKGNKILDHGEVKTAKELRGEMNLLQRGLKNATANAKTFGQVFNSISSKVAHVGSAMQSMGNALTRLTSPFRRLTTGLVMGAGYKALNMLTSGFSGAFERADIMNTYDKSLKALNLDAEETFKVFTEVKTAKENLDEAVQGLPTGLDEIMAAQKVYAGATGEMVNSTKTAIAANNAFLASGMGSREQRFMQKYLVAMASGAELTTTQWQSMARIAPLVMRSVSKELGYAEDEYERFTEDVQKGRIAGEEFLKAFQEVGINGAVAKAARVQAMTWSGLASNITIATKRMGQNIIETLNDTFKEKTGRTLLATLLGWDDEGNDLEDGIKHWINNISTDVQDWIKAHPDEIVGFFEKLKSLDIKGLLKGIAEGMGDVYRFAKKVGGALQKIFPNASLEGLGKRMVKWNLLGSALSIFGGLLKGGRHPIAGTVAFGWLLKNKFGKGGLFGRIASFFGRKKDIQTVSETASAVTTASPKLLSAFKNMALLSGIIAMPAFTAWGVTAAAKNSIKNFRDTINLLKGIKWADAKKVLLGIGGFLGGSAILGGVVGQWGVGLGTKVAIGEVIVGVITSIATGFFALDMGFIKTGIDNFVQSVNLLKMIPDVKSFGDVTQKINDAINVFNEVSSLLTGRYVDKGQKEGGLQEIGFFTGWNLDRLANALEHLKRAAENITKLSSISIPPNAVNRVGDIIDDINEIMSKMWKLIGFGFGNISGNVKKVADAMFEMRRAVYHINKFETEKINKKGLKGLKDAIKKISEAFSADKVGDLRGQITSFIAAIQDALAEFDKLNEDIEIKATVKLSNDFDRSVDAIVREIGLASRRIKLAWANIPTFLNKTISLNLNGKLNSNVGDKLRMYDSSISGGGHNAKGGLIYRAGGGGVPFKRRGTDTVPAMLTPGEYVHNRRAVNTFGIDFMRKVNNLDMKGAMNELMHRAGHMANVNRGTTINNTNYNNQRVVINNNNAGAGFTFKSASRFVGAF